MQVKTTFADLRSVLSYFSVVFSAKHVQDRAKDVFFLPQEDGTVLVAATTNIVVSRMPLEGSVDFELSDDEGAPTESEMLTPFAINSVLLGKMLSAYDNLSKTHITDVVLRKQENYVLVELHEEPNDEEDAELAQVGHYRLRLAPDRPATIEQVSNPFPEEGTEVLQTEDLRLYTSTMLGLLTETSAGGLTSLMQFQADYIVAHPQQGPTLMANRLGESLQGFALEASSVRYLQKLTEGVGDVIEIGRNDRQILVRAGEIETFILTKPSKIDYTKEGEHLRDDGIVVDRRYFLDVLRRVSILEGTLTATVSDGVLKIAIDDFEQDIPILMIKGQMEGVSIKPSATALMSAILPFSDSLFLYFVKEGKRGYSLYIRDETDAWVSVQKVSTPSNRS